jgi:hypothetical protein
MAAAGKLTEVIYHCLTVKELYRYRGLAKPPPPEN